MEVLERLLFDLQSSIEQNDSVLEPSTIVSNIAAHAFSDELGDVDQEYISHLLFQSENPPSLLVFLRDSSHSKDNKELVKAKVQALKFLAQYIKGDESIEQYAMQAFSAFYSSFMIEESNEVKTASLLPLKNILRRGGRSQNTSGKAGDSTDDLSRILLPEKINLVAVYEMMFKELRTNKKITKGMRCELLKVMGLLTEFYSDHEHIKLKLGALIDFCLFELKRNFSGGAKEPELSTIAGTFSCIDRCMFFEESRNTFSGNTELWGYLLKAISAAGTGDLTRFAVVCKALRLIKHHTNIFHTLIGKNAIETYKAVLQCHKTGKPSIVKHSDDALYSVLSEISSAAVSGVSGDALKVLQNLFNASLSSLISTSTEDKAVVEAVKSISAVAPSLSLLNLSECSATLTGVEKKNMENIPNTILGILQAIVQAADRDVEDDEDGGGEEYGVLRLKTSTAVRTSLFLHAAASIIYSSQGSLAMPPSIMSYLYRASTDIIVAYCRLNSKQQITVHKALCFLLYGLDPKNGHHSLSNTQSTNNSDTSKTRNTGVKKIQKETNLSRSDYRNNDSNNMDRAPMNSTSSQLHSSVESAESMGPESLLAAYLDNVLPTLLLRTLSRRVDEEDAVVNPALLSLLIERIGGGLCGGDTGAGPFGDRLVPAYFSLWCEIFSSKELDVMSRTDKGEGDGGRMDKSVCVIVYDRLMLETLKYLRGLDLSYTTASASSSKEQQILSNTTQSQDFDDVCVNAEQSEGTETEDSIIARNPSDQDLLLSLMIFFELFMSVHTYSRLTVWYRLLVTEIVQLARMHPLVSPLYRLMLSLSNAIAAIPSIATALISHFDNSPSSSSSLPSSLASSLSLEDTYSTVLTAVLTVRSFIADVQSTQMPYFRDELLSTALTLVLRAPHHFVPLHSLLASIALSLRTGVRAINAVNALHAAALRHTSTCDDSVYLDKCLNVLLPLLDPYLMTLGGEKSASGQISLQTKSGVGTLQMKKAKAMMMRKTDFYDVQSTADSTLDGPGSAEFNTPDRIENKNLHRSIVRLLGILGGRNQKLLVNPSLAVQASAAWNGSDCLTIDLPLPLSLPLSHSATSSRSFASTPHLKYISLSLDKLLPRVVELCSPQGQSGSDSRSGSGSALNAPVESGERMKQIIFKYHDLS